MKDSPLTEGNMRHGVKPTPPKGRVLKEGEQPRPHHYTAPIAPPPAGRQAPAMHYGTDRKASELSERGFKLEGYIMRDEIGDVALIHCGRVVWLTPDEMDSILSPNSNFKVKYSDEEN
jgi:hypothetical protein